MSILHRTLSHGLCVFDIHLQDRFKFSDQRDQKRKRRKTLSLTGLFQTNENEEKEFQPPDEKSLPEDDILEDEQRKVIEKAIATLPDKYRAPIILRDVEEKTYEEVAEILELGLGTTKSRISRGRKLLREKLEHYF